MRVEKIRFRFRACDIKVLCKSVEINTCENGNLSVKRKKCEFHMSFLSINQKINNQYTFHRRSLER